MKAFVLAGGLGTRLKPRFGELPKPLAPLAGRPFLAHQLDWLEANGVAEVVLCIGHGAAAIRDALGDGGHPRVRLRYSEETEPLGTGGALRHAAPFLDGPCWVLNGDTLAEADPWRLERARFESGALAAIALFEVEDARARGRVECDRHGRIVRFVEKDTAAPGRAWVNGGLYAMSSALWRRLPAGPSSLERTLLPALAAEGRLLGVPFSGTFWDIGTPEEWERAERRFSR